ncbi:MAG: signal transduction histidine kinase [Polaribacter sp.]|jgi:signal transduction histidine kinase
MKKNKLLKLTIFLMVFVAALIFASILLFQHLIENQENDGTIINLSGRQRMLSQKITKTCLLIVADKDIERKTKFYEILKEDLQNFTSVQNKLIQLNNSPKITSLLISYQKSYQTIVTNAPKIMEVNNYQQQKYLLAILENEPHYLENMNTIVYAYASQNRNKIVYFKKLFILTNSTIIIFMVFIVLFIIIPSINQKELNELKLKKALLKEKELNELKSRFVATTSHEFRTPLSAINFAAGSIKKYWAKMGPVMIEKKLQKIENQVKYMTTLLDNILVAGKAEATKTVYNPIYINLGEFINEIIEEIDDSFEKSHEIAVIDTKGLKNATIFIDEKLGRNIFINILSNAIKFSPDADKITIELSSEKEFTLISVTDFGIGIPKVDHATIFKSFTRGKNVDLIQGTGLGLSIVKDAIDALKGKIIINSAPGKGSTFTVKIPKI